MTARNFGQITNKPLEHYTKIFAELEPNGISARTSIPYDEKSMTFTVTLMGTGYAVCWPSAEMVQSTGGGSSDGGGASSSAALNEKPAQCSNGTLSKSGLPEASGDVLIGVRNASGAASNPYEQILILRYLCEGRYIEPVGQYIAYNEIPWGDVYGSNFQGRVIGRFLREFGTDIDTFRLIMENTPELGAVRGQIGDASYSFDLMNGLPMRVIVHEGDDEFPASAQLLYDKTVVFGFTAEDVAVAGDIFIARLKALRKALPGSR